MSEKPRRAVVSEILDPSLLAPTIIPWSKLLRSLAMHILTFNQTVTGCLDACLPALYSKPRQCDSLSVGAIHSCEQGGVLNKLTTECRTRILAQTQHCASVLHTGNSYNLNASDNYSILS
jgi:hypothetical protein